jgi:hypothetical protein
MFQAQRMPEVVNGFLQRALEQQVGVGAFAVEIAAQAVQRDDRDSMLLAGVAEDELVRRLVQVEIGDRQTQAVDRAAVAGHPRHQRVQEHLLAHAVLGRTRDAQGPLDFTAEQEPLFQAKRQTF